MELIDLYEKWTYDSNEDRSNGCIHFVRHKASDRLFCISESGCSLRSVGGYPMTSSVDVDASTGLEAEAVQFMRHFQSGSFVGLGY